jgi:chromosome segregation ATPase
MVLSSWFCVTIVKKESDGTLHSELLSVQKQLEQATPTDDINSKKAIQEINTKLNSALEKSAHMESRLTSVIEVSKQTILQKTDEIKQLEGQSQEEKLTISSMTKELEGLKAEVNALHDDNKEINSLLKNSQLEVNVNEDGLSHRLKALIAMSSASAILNTKLKSQLDDSNTKEQSSQHEIEALHLKLAELETYREDGNTVQDLQTRLKELEENITDLQTQLQTYHDVISALNQEKEGIQSQFENSKQISEQKLADLQKEKDDMAESKEVEKNELHKQVNDLTNKNALLEPLCSESDKLREQVQLLETQITQELTNKEEREKQHSGILDENNIHIESLEKERVSLLEQLEHQKASLDSNTAQVSSLEQELTQVKEQLELKETEKNALEEELKTKQESLAYENTRLLSQVQILKGSTSDEVQQVAENNRMLNETLEKAQNSVQVLQSENDQLRKQLETISADAQHAVALTAQVSTLNESLEAAKEDAKQLEDLKSQLIKAEVEISSLKSSKDTVEQELRELLQENKEKSELSLKEANIESDKLTSELKLFQTRLLEAESEINRLKEELVCMEETSKKAAQAVIDENERLEDQVHQIEENAHVVSSENKTLKEEIDLLSKNTARRTLVNENQKMKNELVTVSHLQQENASLQELVECLQGKIKELSVEDPIQQGVHVASPSFKNGHGDNSKTGTNQQQEELVLMHTRAQLGLIEFLEGESNIPQAMARFKKQLETEMNEFTNSSTGKSTMLDSSTDVSDSDQQPTQNEPIHSISSSGRMR